MTESQAIAQINADAVEAQSLASSILGDFVSFDDTVSQLEAAVDAAGIRLEQLEANVRYAMEKYL